MKIIKKGKSPNLYQGKCSCGCEIVDIKPTECQTGINSYAGFDCPFKYLWCPTCNEKIYVELQKCQSK